MASILVVFYISARITNPLRLIRENLRKMQLGKVSKPIDYAYDDEIGLLVTEYNNKVDELALRAAQLARSEREMAWREMAKQIAHEIKNPLTPMKLNIQFLQRTSVENPNEYKEKIKRITDTIIEQIDNLSAIAAEFSNFAKMPKAKNQVFDLMTKLNETIQLYNYSGQVDIDIKQGCDQTLWVMADPEQFSRAIINIVRNAIQAIPDTVRGKIEIVVQSENQWAIIQIKDNGKGMPEDLKEKIFVPNFTTKSSGTGLGLAITRNIIESFNGNIWFVSEPDKGTTFFIKITLHNYE
jgi:nitrogen fixation/metabolism regulation signal transduction histidine kinase